MTSGFCFIFLKHSSCCIQRQRLVTNCCRVWLGIWALLTLKNFLNLPGWCCKLKSHKHKKCLAKQCFQPGRLHFLGELCWSQLDILAAEWSFPGWKILEMLPKIREVLKGTGPPWCSPLTFNGLIKFTWFTKGSSVLLSFSAGMGIDTWDKTLYFTQQSKGRTWELTLGHTST